MRFYIKNQRAKKGGVFYSVLFPFLFWFYSVFVLVLFWFNSSFISVLFGFGADGLGFEVFCFWFVWWVYLVFMGEMGKKFLFLLVARWVIYSVLFQFYFRFYSSFILVLFWHCLVLVWIGLCFFCYEWGLLAFCLLFYECFILFFGGF